MNEFEKLQQALADLEDEDFFDLLETIMNEQPGEAQQVLTACQKGMDEVGKLFEENVYYVGDLVFAGEMFSKGMEIIKPALGGSTGSTLGKMILCTVKDDLHDIGKNIVRALLEAAGFEVVDLGIDTPADVIVQTAKEQGIRIIALSGVLTLAINSMKDVVDAFKAAGMRNDVKIIIGGNPITEESVAFTGADEWAVPPQKTIAVCTEWAKA